MTSSVTTEPPSHNEKKKRKKKKKVTSRKGEEPKKERRKQEKRRVRVFIAKDYYCPVCKTESDKFAKFCRNILTQTGKECGISMYNRCPKCSGAFSAGGTFFKSHKNKCKGPLRVKAATKKAAPQPTVQAATQPTAQLLPQQPSSISVIPPPPSTNVIKIFGVDERIFLVKCESDLVKPWTFETLRKRVKDLKRDITCSIYDREGVRLEPEILVEEVFTDYNKPEEFFFCNIGLMQMALHDQWVLSAKDMGSVS